MRDVKIDNIKGMLILLVVLGHMLETELGYGMNKSLYVVLYSFHMPLFVYTTGYFAKFNPGRLVKNLLYPYVVFQTLYLLFEKFVLGNQVNFQYTSPYWILWYLFAVIIWTMLLPLFTVTHRYRVVLLLLSCFAALFAGYMDSIGRFLSLSRIFVFFPFFLWGRYSREWKRSDKRKLLMPTVVLAGISIGYCIINSSAIKIGWLYEANSYVRGNYQFSFRLIHMAMAAVFIGLAVLLVSDRQIPFFSKLGQNTMPIFLMHGFLIKLIGKYEFISLFPYKTAAAVILTIVMVLLLQSKPVLLLVSPFLRWNGWRGK